MEGSGTTVANVEAWSWSPVLSVTTKLISKMPSRGNVTVGVGPKTGAPSEAICHKYSIMSPSGSNDPVPSKVMGTPGIAEYGPLGSAVGAVGPDAPLRNH